MKPAKRDAILAATLRLVSQRGFHGASMAMIAAEAGAGAGTIYNYFPSKDALVKALYVQIKGEFVQMALQSVVEDLPVQERFSVMWRNIIRYFVQYPERAAFALQFYSSPYFAQLEPEQVNSLMSPLVSPFESAMQAGAIKAIPMPVLEAFTMDVASSLARRHSRGEIRLDDDWIARTGEMVWSAIAIQPPPRKE